MRAPVGGSFVPVFFKTPLQVLLVKSYHPEYQQGGKIK